jgi:hypothetical protein
MVVGANSEESPRCLDQRVGGELEPAVGHVVGDRAEGSQGGMLTSRGKTPLATVLPEDALPPLDLGPERVEVLGASQSFELAPGLLDFGGQVD